MGRTMNTKAALLLCCTVALVCIVIAGTALAAAHDSDNPRSATKWQYMAFEHDVINGPLGGELGKTITKVGRDGWELVSTANYLKDGTTVSTVFYFKRPL